ASSELASLLAHERELSAQAERIDAERAALRSRILASQPASPLSPSLLSQPHPALLTRWRPLSEVQAEVMAMREAGELVPFGAPNRRPRVCASMPWPLPPALRGESTCLLCLQT
ncbi:MAG: hypothetical protein SGPRY_011960, partial [Prymnesium sp.]